MSNQFAMAVLSALPTACASASFAVLVSPLFAQDLIVYTAKAKSGQSVRTCTVKAENLKIDVGSPLQIDYRGSDSFGRTAICSGFSAKASVEVTVSGKIRPTVTSFTGTDGKAYIWQRGPGGNKEQAWWNVHVQIEALDSKLSKLNTGTVMHDSQVIPARDHKDGDYSWSGVPITAVVHSFVADARGDVRFRLCSYPSNLSSAFSGGQEKNSGTTFSDDFTITLRELGTGDVH